MTAARSMLFITSQLPWPLNSGGHLRTFHLLSALAKQFRVKLWTTVAEPDETGVSRLRERGVDVQVVVVGKRTLAREIPRVLWAAACRRPYVLFLRQNRRPLRRAIEDSLREQVPDVVYCDHLDPYVFAPILPNVPLVVDFHNVYSKLVARVAGEERRWPVRMYLQREARLLARMEQRAVAAASAVMAVSEEERRHFASLDARHTFLVPNGVDCSEFAHLPTGRVDSAPSILFLGAMSWEPNIRAAEFLARQAMPRVQARVPDARLLIVGRSPTAEVQQLAELPGVEVTGTVPEILPYLADARVMAVPLDAGGGTRLKILEAFAAGLPVVSTRVGCEGIEAEDGRHLLIASRERFADAIVDVLENSSLSRALAETARTLVAERYDWSRIGQQVCRAVESVWS